MTIRHVFSKGVVAAASTGWPSAPASNYLAGPIDEVTVHTTALSAARVTAHHAAAST